MVWGPAAGSPAGSLSMGGMLNQRGAGGECLNRRPGLMARAPRSQALPARSLRLRLARSTGATR